MPSSVGVLSSRTTISQGKVVIRKFVGGLLFSFVTLTAWAVADYQNQATDTFLSYGKVKSHNGLILLFK